MTVEVAPVRALATTVRSWLADGHRVALGRVVETHGFGVVTPAEVVAVRGDGATAGGLLGGAADAPVARLAREVLAADPAAAAEADVPVGERKALDAGLACAGRARLLVHALGPDELPLWDVLAGGGAAALVTRVHQGRARSAVVLPDGTGSAGASGAGGADVLDDSAREAALDLLRRGATATSRADGLLVDAWVPVPELLVVGGGAIGAALEAQAGLLGWRSRTVTGRAEAVAAVEGFGAADVLVLLDHDPALDEVLATGLRGRRGFLGALGSRHTQAERRGRLLDGGLTEADLERLHGPVGLDLGARSPAEVAVSVVAEVIAERSGRRPAALRDAAGPINPR